MYEIFEVPGWKAIRRLSDGAIIPMDTDNTDYQEYLAWLETNKPQEEQPAPAEPSV